jgi:hypothetical protein
MSEPSSGWSREFDEPIALPHGRRKLSFIDLGAGVGRIPCLEWRRAVTGIGASRAVVPISQLRTMTSS